MAEKVIAKTKAMNKGDLIDAVAKDTEVPKTVIAKVLNSFTANVTKSVKKGVSVILVGFGTFKKVHSNAKKGVNPKTKEAIDIAAKDRMKFKASKSVEI